MSQLKTTARTELRGFSPAVHLSISSALAACQITHSVLSNNAGEAVFLSPLHRGRNCSTTSTKQDRARERAQGGQWPAPSTGLVGPQILWMQNVRPHSPWDLLKEYHSADGGHIPAQKKQ